MKDLILRYKMPWLCRILRIVWIPGPNLRKYLKFVGPFSLHTKNDKRLRLQHQGYFLENELFWLGWDDFYWEKTSRSLWEKHCEKAETILDIGANTGLFAMFAQASNPAAKVIAFEPQPNIFSTLQKNSTLNGSKVICEQLALSDQEGELPFYNYGEGAFAHHNTTAGSLNAEWRTTDQQSIKVRVATLEAYLTQNKIEKVDLIKLDVETLEPEVLAGYGPLLAEHRPVVLLEIQDRKIGDRIAAFFQTVPCTFFHIEEATGPRQVSELGGHGTDHNYLIVPDESAESARA
ncbi:MAG: FkbM family methyltransferase [Bacteroidia bacterium]